MRKKIASTFGFSLIEITISLMVMGIIASMLLPNMSQIVKIAKHHVLKNIFHTTQLALETHHLLTGAYPVGILENNQLFSRLHQSDALSKIPTNPFSGMNYQDSEPSGRIIYRFNQSQRTYELTVYGKNNESVVSQIGAVSP